MNHRPAVKGLIKMGPLAVPKLSAALRNDTDSEVRFYAAFCLASIGGASAADSLRQALASESDACVRRIILVSLDSFDDNGNIKDRTKWLSGLACD
jgi:HEAT repeat protein